MEIKRFKRNGMLVALVKERRIDLDVALQMAEQMETFADMGENWVIVDLRKVEEIDPGAVDTLCTTVADLDGEHLVVFCNASIEVKSAMAREGASTPLPVFDVREEALAAIRILELSGAVPDTDSGIIPVDRPMEQALPA